jgi:hypothetical protein
MPLVTEERYRTPFYMPLYTFIHNLLNVLVQTANTMGLKKSFFSVSHALYLHFLNSVAYIAPNRRIILNVDLK